MRVAIIGAGWIAAEHAAILRRLDGVELTAVCDIDEQRARELAGSGAVYTDWHEQAPKTLGILYEGGGPLGSCKLRFEVVGRKHGDRARSLSRRAIHFKNEIAPGGEVPCLEHDGHPFFLENPADPFGPAQVRGCIANEKIRFHCALSRRTNFAAARLN